MQPCKEQSRACSKRNSLAQIISLKFELFLKIEDFQGRRSRVPLFDFPEVDLNTGACLLGKSTTPGFKSTLGWSKSGPLHRRCSLRIFNLQPSIQDVLACASSQHFLLLEGLTKINHVLKKLCANPSVHLDSHLYSGALSESEQSGGREGEDHSSDQVFFFRWNGTNCGCSNPSDLTQIPSMVGNKGFPTIRVPYQKA